MICSQKMVVCIELKCLLKLILICNWHILPYQNDLDQFESNVKATLSCDNTNRIQVSCRFVRLGASKAQYPYLLFVHAEYNLKLKIGNYFLVQRPDAGA
jgi:hypothetical protein